MSRFPRDGAVTIGFALLALAAIGLTRLYGYLLFHSLSELFSVAITVGIFMLAWHSRRITELPYFLFIAIWGLSTAVIDILHMLAYQEMGVFPGIGTNIPTEVKKLSGLLPICAGCKKIRNDKGYWEQIEAYISDHSQAEFSHGLCPDCARRLYPELKD